MNIPVLFITCRFCRRQNCDIVPPARPLTRSFIGEIMTNQYITGSMIKNLREQKKLTQAELAEKIFVTDKAVSKWETGRGYPDISLVESLAKALDISVIELLSGKNVINTNRQSNMNRVQFYVCPVCGNIIQSTGEALISCCGITLPPLEAEQSDKNHSVRIERIEDEFFVSIEHEMTKNHYISFIAAIRSDSVEIQKLYPEQNAEASFKISGTEQILFYCNQHGLYKN